MGIMCNSIFLRAIIHLMRSGQHLDRGSRLLERQTCSSTSRRNIQAKYRTNFEKGFTLIELLVVIAIIGVLASVVLASLNSARDKARDATIKQQVRQFATLMALEYNDNSSYNNLNKGWAGTSATCESRNYEGNYAAKALEICNGIIALTPNGANQFYTGAATSVSRDFSIMALLSSGWFCIGSSGATYEGPANPGGGNWTGSGCFANP